MADWSRWSNKRDMKYSFSGFLAEAGTFMSGDPKEIAMQKGWKPDNFGWYRDGSGQVVARSVGGKMVVYDGNPNTNLPSQTDMGNPAVTAGQKPAERARTMGLQSNGKGGYVDDSGQVVARTVNGELVFYDGNGGAVTDGAGGKDMVMSQPSWVDPDTGLIMVPPAQPETPEELAATPDPLPATPPMGFDLFVKQKHKQVKGDLQAKAEAEADLTSQQEELENLFSSNPSAQQFKKMMDTVIAIAGDTGDEYKMDISFRVQQSLEERGQEIVSYFDTVETDKHEELSAMIKRMIIFGAKSDWAQENLIDPINDDETMTDDEKLEQRLLARSSAKGSVIGKDAPVRQEIAKIVDETEKRQSEKMMNVEARNIEGEKVTYTLKKPDESFTNVNKVLRKAKKTMKKVGGEVTGVQEIIWNTNDDTVDQADEAEKRSVALDALRTWRQQVLPSLEPGTVLTNTPTQDEDNQRERIYQLAGFGAFDEKLGTQAGIVIDDDGEKRVIPLDGPSNKSRLKEGLAAAMCSNETIGQMLLEDYFS